MIKKINHLQDKIFHKDHSRLDYSHYSFDQKKFETELKVKLNSQKKLNYSTFQTVFLEILNKIAPVKVKVLRFNNNTFMTKSLRKVIMRRSTLKKNFNKKSINENWDNYKKQKIARVRLLISGNKKFWKP